MFYRVNVERQQMDAKLKVHVYETSTQLGAAAAQHVAERIRLLAAENDVVPVLFATGASQLETLRALVQMPGIPWERVIGFHMDEYIGISGQHPASFRCYLHEELVRHVPMRHFYYMDGNAPDPGEFCLRYAALLREHEPQLCLAGIGENGHLAFNDPHEADFDDPVDVKIVTLDEACRGQQVAEGWYPSLHDVPSQAITLTMPALIRVPEIILSVPGKRKHAVIQRTINEAVSTTCPSTILRTHANAHVYVDENSYSK